jgi:hypothetical protein
VLELVTVTVAPPPLPCVVADPVAGLSAGTVDVAALPPLGEMGCTTGAPLQAPLRQELKAH